LTHPVDEVLPAPKLFTLGLQHVLVMYAGAVAVPLIVGRALKLEPADVAFLISADLFVCGIVTLIQSLGATPVVRHPAAGDDGRDLRRRRPDGRHGQCQWRPRGRPDAIFGAIIAAGMISILIAP
jgi:xanthine/uracil permease